MKVIKPLNISLLNRVVEEKRRLSLISSVISIFSFESKGKLLGEVELWKFIAEELGEEAAFDSGMLKPRGEVLVTGSFYSLGGRAVHAGKVQVQLGNLDKELHVYGDRFWKKQNFDSWLITEPKTITELAISYENSFGGQDYPKNPLGKGYIKDIEAIERDEVYPLPNIIDPREPLTDPAREIEPAGFGPYDLIWPQRFSKAGTYDQQWLKELFPGLASDIDHTIFNTAPLDQQLNGYFNGDEEFVCQNMHPEKPFLCSQLPAILPRCFLRQDKGNEKIFQEVPLQLDTIWLFPHAEKGIIIHRGQIEVNDDQAFDVTEMLLAYENLADPVRPVEHYKDALTKRLDPDKDFLYLLKDKDLIPEGEESCFKAFIEDALKDQEPSLLQKHALTKQQNEAVKANQRFEELGFEVDDDIFDKIMEKSVEEPFPDLENLDILIENSIKEAEDTQKEMEDFFRKKTEAMGLSYEQLIIDSQKKAGGRIEFSADEIINQLRLFGNSSPEKEEKLKQTEKHFDDLYRQYGHFGPAANAASQEENDKLREMVCRRYREGKSLAGVDLTGVDLSGLDLTGVDFQGAFMEGSDLSRTNLENANLNHCMLARAKLTHCLCDGAQMEEVNFGEADLSGASFKECFMENAVLYRSILKGSQFYGAKLTGADLMECNGDEANMQAADLSNGQFMEGTFRCADFSKSNLNEALFLKSKLEKANFQEATLNEAIFVQTNGDEAQFSRADLTNMRAVMDISFRGADFSYSTLVDANLRGANLSGTNFTEADLSGADLSEAKLSKSRFYRAVAKQTMFMKADLSEAYMVSINLFEGSLQQAKLTNTDLRGSNLFAADLLKVDFSQSRIEQANIGRTILNS